MDKRLCVLGCCGTPFFAVVPEVFAGIVPEKFTEVGDVFEAEAEGNFFHAFM